MYVVSQAVSLGIRHHDGRNWIIVGWNWTAVFELTFISSFYFLFTNIISLMSESARPMKEQSRECGEMDGAEGEETRVRYLRSGG